MRLTRVFVVHLASAPARRLVGIGRRSTAQSRAEAACDRARKPISSRHIVSTKATMDVHAQLEARLLEQRAQRNPLERERLARRLRQPHQIAQGREGAAMVVLC